MYQNDREMRSTNLYDDSAYHDQSVDVIIYKKDSNDYLKLLSPLKNTIIKKNDSLIRNISQDLYASNQSALASIKKVNITFGSHNDSVGGSPTTKLLKGKVIEIERQTNAFLRKSPAFMNQTARDNTPYRIQQQKIDNGQRREVSFMQGVSSQEKMDLGSYNDQSFSHPAKLPNMKSTIKSLQKQSGFG